MEKTGENKREEETWREKREAAARLKALIEKDMRVKAVDNSKEVEGGGEEGGKDGRRMGRGA